VFAALGHIHIKKVAAAMPKKSTDNIFSPNLDEAIEAMNEKLTKTVTFKTDKRIPQRQGSCTYQLTEFLWKMTYLAFQLQKVRSN
jgi:hypothetical protein